jgi:nitrous oxidase accessory protein NosD
VRWGARWRRNRVSPGIEPAVPAPPPIRTLIDGAVGKEVTLPAGTYHERILLERPLTLSAQEGPGTVKLFVENGTALTVDCGATVRGLVIETHNQARPALVIAGGSPVFEDCEMLGGRVEATGDATPTFRRCRIHATALAGLYVTGRSQPRLEECVLADVWGSAMVVTGEAIVQVFATTISGAASAGVRVHGNGRAVVDGCTIMGSQGPGLLVEDHAGVLLRGCVLADGAAEGIRVDNSSALADDLAPHGSAEFAADTAETAGPATMIRGVTLVGCEVSRAASEGIVAAAGGIRLLRTRLAGVHRTGVLAGGTAQIELQDFAITDAGAHGLVVTGGARLRALRMKVTGCGENGVMAAQDAEIELIDSECTGSARAAVNLTGQAVAKAVGCQIGTTPEHGVLVSGNAMLMLSGCAIDACGQNGIRVVERGDVTLRECTLSNAHDGVVLKTPHHPLLDRCTMTGIAGIGIEIGADTSPLLSGCLVTGAGSAEMRQTGIPPVP